MTAPASAAVTTAEAPARALTPAVRLALLAGPLLSMVDSSVVNVAIPDIGRELHRNLADVQWTVSGYLLALAATLPATSWLAKRLGTIRVYGASLAAFTLTSVLCAFASNVPMLVAGRVLQGVSAAPLVPLSMNLFFGSASDRRMPATAGMVLALLSTGLVLALYGASKAPEHGWLASAAGPFWIAGLALVSGYVAWARRRDHPAVDLGLLRRPQPALAVWLCMLASVAGAPGRRVAWVLPVFNG
jgi:MFS family permease